MEQKGMARRDKISEKDKEESDAVWQLISSKQWSVFPQILKGKWKFIEAYRQQDKGKEVISQGRIKISRQSVGTPDQFLGFNRAVQVKGSELREPKA